MTRVRIATYNVHKCRGLDFKVSPFRISNVIEEIHADAIALQEVFGPQAEHLAQLLGLHVVFDATAQLRGLHYGNAVLSRFPLLSSESFDVSVHLREPRRCLRVDLTVPGETLIHLWAVHLGTSFFERRHQARKLVSAEILGRQERSGPRVLVGDFNEWTRGLVSRTLAQSMRSADTLYHLKRGRTYPGVLPFWHLDHMYYDPPLELAAMHLHRTRTSLVASDHLPLVGDFEVG